MQYFFADKHLPSRGGDILAGIKSPLLAIIYRTGKNDSKSLDRKNVGSITSGA